MKYKLEHSIVVLTGVHSQAVCATFVCPIHRKTNHTQRSWPQNWRTDRKFMERICPHGIGHPDPDHMTNMYERGYDAKDIYAESVHGCDGCCQPSKGRN